MLLSEFHPRPKLQVETTDIVRPRYLVIDAHNHLSPPFSDDWKTRPVSELLDVLDEARVQVLVDLDRCPNFYVDIAARIAELGRQPFTARKFFIRYADRILFGTDLSPNLQMYRLHYRFLESEDEYFNYALEEPPPQGRWRIYGLYLPDDVLEKVYRKNALKVLNIQVD